MTSVLQLCRRCGCSDMRACSTDDGPCFWVAPGFCSACVLGATLQRYTGTSAGVFVITGGLVRILPHRRDLRDHSPDGFNWGYEGSGPAQLALALAAHLLGVRATDANDKAAADRAALAIYEDLKHAYVAALPQAKPWSIDAFDLARLMGALFARQQLVA